MPLVARMPLLGCAAIVRKGPWKDNTMANLVLTMFYVDLCSTIVYFSKSCGVRRFELQGRCLSEPVTKLVV